jgi:hypothetical protein
MRFIEVVGRGLKLNLFGFAEQGTQGYAKAYFPPPLPQWHMLGKTSSEEQSNAVLFW